MGRMMVKRPYWHEKYLSKAFAIRQILKWKYNYYEAVPEEHQEYRHFLRHFRVFRNSFRFKKLWRLRMDELFYEEAKLKILRLKEVVRGELKTEKVSSKIDPSRLLLNYDSEVLAAIRRVRDDFLIFMKYPKSYPYYEEEMRSFEAQQFGSNHYKDEEFRRYWVHRISSLCDMNVIREKRLIRENWRKLLPAYNGQTAGAEELQGLLSSDQESEYSQRSSIM